MNQLTQLAKPFASHLIHRAATGKYGDYVSHWNVEQKLLAVIGPHSFAVEQVIYEDGVVHGCVARLTATIDEKTVQVAEVGDCEQPGNWKTNGQRLKDAASDAYKRCAMRLGVGLHLWAGEDFFLYDYLVGQHPPTVVPEGAILVDTAEEDPERPFA